MEKQLFSNFSLVLLQFSSIWPINKTLSDAYTPG